MMRLPSMRNPVPDARWGRSKIQGAAQLGATYSVKIWTTDFSASEPSSTGVPSGGADVRIGGAAGWDGVITPGSVPAEPGELPGTIGLGGTTGIVVVPPALPPPAAGLMAPVLTARSGNGNEATARPIRQVPTKRKDNM